MTSKFPALIHVTRVYGVVSLDEPQPVAIYKLVEVGTVRILKSFQTPKKGRTK